ncbi:MAG: hypothetical protein QM813_03385 [Verrucomicrobiota bacterium]
MGFSSDALALAPTPANHVGDQQPPPKGGDDRRNLRPWHAQVRPPYINMIRRHLSHRYFQVSVTADRQAEFEGKPLISTCIIPKEDQIPSTPSGVLTRVVCSAANNGTIDTAKRQDWFWNSSI